MISQVSCIFRTGAGLAHRFADDTNASQAYSILGFMWGFGAVVGPVSAIAGLELTTRSWVVYLRVPQKTSRTASLATSVKATFDQSSIVTDALSRALPQIPIPASDFVCKHDLGLRLGPGLLPFMGRRCPWWIEDSSPHREE